MFCLLLFCYLVWGCFVFLLCVFFSLLVLFLVCFVLKGGGGDCLFINTNHQHSIYILNNQESSIGLTEKKFNTRFNLHKSSFKLENKRTSTTLSEHVWELKNKNMNFNIKWELVKKVKPFALSDKVCKHCLQEKLSIIRSAPSLNKGIETFGHCIHRKKNLA